jgi:hypothetical protein
MVYTLVFYSIQKPEKGSPYAIVYRKIARKAIMLPENKHAYAANFLIFLLEVAIGRSDASTVIEELRSSLNEDSSTLEHLSGVHTRKEGSTVHDVLVMALEALALMGNHRVSSCVYAVCGLKRPIEDVSLESGEKKKAYHDSCVLCKLAAAGCMANDGLCCAQEISGRIGEYYVKGEVHVRPGVVALAHRVLQLHDRDVAQKVYNFINKPDLTSTETIEKLKEYPFVDCEARKSIRESNGYRDAFQKRFGMSMEKDMAMQDYIDRVMDHGHASYAGGRDQAELIIEDFDAELQRHLLSDYFYQKNFYTEGKALEEKQPKSNQSVGAEAEMGAPDFRPEAASRNAPRLNYFTQVAISCAERANTGWFLKMRKPNGFYLVFNIDVLPRGMQKETLGDLETQLSISFQDQGTNQVNHLKLPVNAKNTQIKVFTIGSVRTGYGLLELVHLPAGTVPLLMMETMPVGEVSIIFRKAGNIAAGVASQRDDYVIHDVSTEKGDCGLPLLYNGFAIAIHAGSLNETAYNVAIPLSPPNGSTAPQSLNSKSSRSPSA